MINIAVIEDQDEDFDILKENLEKYYSSRSLDIKLSRYTKGSLFLSEYNFQFHFAIFDIELPDGNGMDIAKKLRERDSKLPLFFVTNIRKYTLNGYEVNAFNYILKPINYYSLSLTLNRISNYLDLHHDSMIEISTKNGKVILNLDTIKCVDISGHAITYHTIDNDFTNYGSLRNIESSLPPSKFIKINSYCIVNVDHISRIEADEVIISNMRFRMSRGKKKEIINKILSLNGGGL